MEFRDILRVLRRGWRSVLALAVLGAFVGGAIGLLQPHRYAATARAFVSVSSAQTLTDLNSGVVFAQQAAQAYAAVASTAYVLRPVIEDLDLTDSPARLADRMQVSVADDSLVVDVTVTDDSAARAATTANAITEQLSTAAVDLTPDTDTAGTTTGSITLTPVDPAVADRRPVGPGPLVTALLGVLTGLVLALVAGVARDLLDTRVRTRQDLERVTTLPLLGTTVRDPQVARQPLVVDASSTSPRAEGYRTIRTSLRFLELDGAARSMVVTSSIDGEGKSVTAANMALAMAGLGRRVLLVDADLRRPRVAQYFGVEGAIGLTDVLIGAVDLSDAVQAFGATGLDLLPAGSVPPNPNEQLQSHAMRLLVQRLHGAYDTVLFDTPPLLAVSDAVVLGEQAGAVIVVAASGRVRRPQLTEAIDGLERAGARVAGIVLTMAPRVRSDAYGYSGAPVAPTTDDDVDAPRKERRRRAPAAAAAPAAAPARRVGLLRRRSAPQTPDALAPEHADAVAPPAAGTAVPPVLDPVAVPLAGAVDDARGLAALLTEAALSAHADAAELPAPVSALRQFARPSLWDDTPRTATADQEGERAEKVQPVEELQTDDQTDPAPAGRRRFTWRPVADTARVDVDADSDADSDADVEAETESVIVPLRLVPSESLQAALEPEQQPATEPQTEVQTDESVPAPIALEPEDTPTPRRGRTRPVKPVRIPPPPELAARLAQQQGGAW